MIHDFIAHSDNSEIPAFNLSVKDILRDDPVLARVYLSKYVYWLNGVITYLSYVCDVSQARLSDLFNYNGLRISQPGIGKRVNQSVIKLKRSLERPRFDAFKLRKLLSPYLSQKEVNFIIVYWELSTFVLTSWITGDALSNYSIRNSLQTLKSIPNPSEEIQELLIHLDFLLSHSSYGDTQFKPFYSLVNS